MAENQKSIYAKIAQVMEKVKRIPKTGYNAFHKYNYVTESDLTEHIRPILLEAKLAFFSTVLEQHREGEFTKVKMEFTIADTETGECLKSIYWGEGQDKGDKGLYKAYTGATKYFLMKTFLIPTGDDPEADTEVDERNAKNPPEQQTKVTTLKAKWKLLAGDTNGFDEFYQKQKAQGYTDEQIDKYLTTKIQEKKKKGA